MREGGEGRGHPARLALEQGPVLRRARRQQYARHRSVETVMAAEKRDVLAAQTLRNSVMAGSFMASTPILPMIGMLTISGSTQNASTLWRALNVGGGPDEALLAWKLVALLADFFRAVPARQGADRSGFQDIPL